MKDERIRILLMEDNRGDATLVRTALAESLEVRFEVEVVNRLSSALKRLRSETFDAILCDLRLPDSQGLATLTKAREASPGVPIVVLTGLDDETIAIQALGEGAQDYIIKNRLGTEALVRSVRYAIQRQRIRESLRVARETLGEMDTRRDPQTHSTLEAEALGEPILDDRQMDHFLSRFESQLGQMLRSRDSERDAGHAVATLVSELAVLGAGPRDIAEIYLRSLGGRTSNAIVYDVPDSREKSLFLALKLMAGLVNHYRQAP